MAPSVELVDPHQVLPARGGHRLTQNCDTPEIQRSCGEAHVLAVHDEAAALKYVCDEFDVRLAKFITVTTLSEAQEQVLVDVPKSFSPLSLVPAVLASRQHAGAPFQLHVSIALLVQLGR